MFRPDFIRQSPSFLPVLDVPGYSYIILGGSSVFFQFLTWNHVSIASSYKEFHVLLELAWQCWPRSKKAQMESNSRPLLSCAPTVGTTVVEAYKGRVLCCKESTVQKIQRRFAPAKLNVEVILGTLKRRWIFLGPSRRHQSRNIDTSWDRTVPHR